MKLFTVVSTVVFANWAAAATTIEPILLSHQIPPEWKNHALSPHPDNSTVSNGILQRSLAADVLARLTNRQTTDDCPDLAFACTSVDGCCYITESCCGFGCMPASAVCCSDLGWCPAGNHCYAEADITNPTADDIMCCTNSMCTRYVDEYGFTHSLSATSSGAAGRPTESLDFSMTRTAAVSASETSGVTLTAAGSGVVSGSSASLDVASVSLTSDSTSSSAAPTVAATTSSPAATVTVEPADTTDTNTEITSRSSRSLDATSFGVFGASVALVVMVALL